MTIRYVCDKCSSVLKIKDDLAGTKGKCPKCSTAFKVPKPDGLKTAATKDDDATYALNASADPEPGKPSPVDDDDPMAVLFMDEPEPTTRKKTPTAALFEDFDEPKREPEAQSPMLKESRRSTPLKPKSGGGTAAGNAADLLSRSTDRDDVDYSRPSRDDPGWDYVGLVRDVGLDFLPKLAAILLVAYGLYYMVYGGDSSGLKIPELGQVSGTVRMSNQPLANAQVEFRPKDRPTEPEMSYATSVGVTDHNGYYILNYVANYNGAVVGKHEVRISAEDETGHRIVPLKYNFNSELLRDVTPGANTLDFDLEARH